MYAVSSRFLLMLFALFLALTTSFFGGNFPLAQGVMPILCAVIWGLTLPYASPSAASSRHRYLIYGVGAPLVLVLVWSFIQVMPLAGSSVWASPYWKIAPDAAWHTMSVQPAATLAYLPYAIGLGLFAWGMFRAGLVQPLNILRVVAVIITLACVYGILAFAFGNTHVMWQPKTSYVTSLSGPFINRNSFATFAGLGVLANFALLLQRVGEISSRLTLRQRFKAFWLLILRPNWPWLFLAMVCFVALVLTNSRAGTTSSICGLMALLVSLAGMRAPLRWPLGIMITLLLIISAVVLATIGNELGQSLTRVVEDAGMRQNINAATHIVISQFPLTGSGLGTYASVFSTARQPELLASVVGVVDHAHNTYLELLAELGYPAMALLAISMLCLLTAYLTGLTVRRRAIIWPALGVATVVLVGGHAFADFSVSIPAVALAAITMLMLALAQSLPVRESAPQSSTWAFRIPLLAVAVALMAVSGWQTAANYQAAQAEATVVNLVNVKPVGPGPIYIAQRQLMQCLEINPLHPTCRESLAQTYISLAAGFGVGEGHTGVGQVYMNMAYQQYVNALNNAPLNPLAWYRLARIEALRGNNKEADADLANSLLTGPSDPVLAGQRIPLMLSLLPKADPENARLFTDNIVRHWQFAPRVIGPELRANPAIHPALARLLVPTMVPTAEENTRWRYFIWQPFPKAAPAPAPLGEAPKNQ